MTPVAPAAPDGSDPARRSCFSLHTVTYRYIPLRTAQLLLVFILLTVHSRRMPYKNRSDDRIALAANLALFFLMLFALQVEPRVGSSATVITASGEPRCR